MLNVFKESSLHLTWLQTEYPDVAAELEVAKALPPISPETTSDLITVLMNDVEIPSDTQLPKDFEPELLTFYCGDELIFLKAQDEVLLNRLPVLFPSIEFE